MVCHPGSVKKWLDKACRPTSAWYGCMMTQLCAAQYFSRVRILARNVGKSGQGGVYDNAGVINKLSAGRQKVLSANPKDGVNDVVLPPDARVGGGIYNSISDKRGAPVRLRGNQARCMIETVLSGAHCKDNDQLISWGVVGPTGYTGSSELLTDWSRDQLA